MITTTMSEALPVLSAPAYRERGFAFRVPICERGRMARRMRRLSEAHDGVFQVDHVGLLGVIRCTFRHRHETEVLAFIDRHMGDRRIRMIDDYQRRYGVTED